MKQNPLEFKFSENLPARYRTGRNLAQRIYHFDPDGDFFLSILLLKIVNDSFGYIAVEYGISSGMHWQSMEFPFGNSQRRIWCSFFRRMSHRDGSRPW